MARRFADRDLVPGEERPTSGPIALSALLRKDNPKRKEGRNRFRPLQASDFDDDDQSEHAESQPNYDDLELKENQLSALPRLQTDFNPSPSEGVPHYKPLAGDLASSATEQTVNSDDISPLDSRKAASDEVLQVFGKRLPDPIHLQQIVGQEEGEIAFIGHPNRDVSAHQWSVDHFQWINIGQFSHARGRVEGQMAGDTLRGRTIGGSIPRNTLAYFKAIAEQRQNAAIDRFRKKQEERTAAAMNRGGYERRPTLYDPDHYASISTASGSLQSDRFPTLGSMGFARHAKQEQAPSQPPPSFHTAGRQVLDDPFVESQPSRHSGGVDPTTPKNRHTVELQGRMDPEFRFPADASSRRESDASRLVREEAARRQLYMQMEEKRIRREIWPRERNGQLRDIEVGEDAEASITRNLPSAASFTHQPAHFSPEDLSKRQAIKANLAEFGKQASNNSPRMHVRTDRIDSSRLPQPTPTMQHAQASVYPPPGLGMPTGTRPPQMGRRFSTLNANAPAYTHPNPLAPAPAHGRTDSMATITNRTANLGVSDPDNFRQMHAPEIATGLGKEPPTAQNWNGPFFANTKPTPHDPTMPLALHDDDIKKLRDWWTDGQRPARQEAYAKMLMDTTRPKIPGGFGAIGQGSPASASRNKDMSRMLVTLYENLKEYTEQTERSNLDGPQDRDYCTRAWTKPPAYAIDDGPNGNLSFFDRDITATKAPTVTRAPPGLGFGGMRASWGNMGGVALPSTIGGTSRLPTLGGFGLLQYPTGRVHGVVADGGFGGPSPWNH